MVVKRYVYLICIIFFSFFFNSILVAQNKKIKVFLLAGQSNMDGRARAYNLSENDKVRLEKASKKVTLFYNHQPEVALQVTKANNYQKNKFEADSLFGPELFFGIELAEKYTKDKFLFIKRSLGGMSLYGAWNPQWDSTKAAHMNEFNKPMLYNDFINYSREVLSKMDTSAYEICGMLWVQGETDAGVKKWGEKPALEYEENLENLIAGVREEFESDIPFMIFQVGHGKVVEGMKNVAKNMKNVSLIPQSKDPKSDIFYERNPIPLGHYNCESMKRIGKQFFECYQRDYAY